MNKTYLGSDFDSFLAEEGILADVEAVASKRVIAALWIQGYPLCFTVNNPGSRD